MRVVRPSPTLAAPLFALVAILGLVVGPSAAQESPPPVEPKWEGSAFDADDLADPGGALRVTPRFDLSGVFQRTVTFTDGGVITGVTYAFDEVEVPDFDLPDDEACIPDDVAAEFTPTNEQISPGLIRAEFDTPQTVEGDAEPVDSIRWPCNGRFLVTATATFGVGSETQSLAATITVAVPPPPPGKVTTSGDDADVTVSWAGAPESARQIIGYRIERAGPADDGAYGDFEAIGDDLAPDAREAADRVTDGGDYRYRVRTLRAGADGPVLSAPVEASVSDIGVTVPTPTTGPTTTRPTTTPTVPGLGAGGAPRPSGPGAPSGGRTTPTTIDLGFDGTLDYGDIPEPGGEDALGDLAGESGSAIINIDEPGAGLAVPFAGAMVLLGWAGHILYLNRLARQF